MPFLLPALVALSCDAVIIYLHRLNGPWNSQSTLGSNSNREADDVLLFRNNTSNDGDPDTEAFYFWVGYMMPLAVIRIFLLLIPLLFHSYTGTAIKHQWFYQILYGVTLAALLIHMLTLLLMNPASLESLLPYGIFGSDDMSTIHEHQQQSQSSDMGAPIYQPASTYDHNPHSDEDGAGQISTSGNDLHYFHRHTQRHLLQHLHALRRVWWMLVMSFVSNSCHIFLLMHVRSSAPANSALFGGKTTKPQSIYFALRLGENTDDPDEADALVHAVNEFLVDVQVRLRRTKQEWSKRLDDFSRRVQERSSMAMSSNSPHGDGSTVPSSTMNTPTTASFANKVLPFRVLLQLFADQDVLQNGRLTAAFDIDQGQTMTFFVPQILSFLLHGATTTSVLLEDWILQRCKHDIQFAHRCYWFLRAWCLEVPGSSTPQLVTMATLSRQNSDSALSALDGSTGHKRVNSASSVGSGGLLAALAPQKGPQSALFLDQPVMESPSPGKGKLSQNTLSGNFCVPASDDQQSHDDKFLPQERAMIERLMLKVKECGENAAQVLEHGGSAALVDIEQLVGSGTSSLVNPSNLMAAIESGTVPIDPMTGRPSQRHVDCMAASQKYGFLPITQMRQKATDSHNLLDSDSTKIFDKTPQFFDSLIFIAESMFHVPRDSRKEELSNMLRQLECELLPDNGVYVPSRRQAQGVLGRVWRVATQECIPISTKERVPCIIALEVVLMDQVKYTSKGSILASMKDPQGSQWSFMEILSSSSSLPPSEDNQSLDVPSLSVSPSSILHPRVTQNQGEATKDAAGSSIYDRNSLIREKKSGGEQAEAELVDEWRTKPRNKLRLVPLINKVADSMKGTMNRVKTTVRKGLNDIRDRAVSEELKSLTSFPDPQDDPAPSSPSSQTMLLDNNKDIEKLQDQSDTMSVDMVSENESNYPDPLTPKSPEVTYPPPTEMGQWSSPSPKTSKSIVAPQLRRRLDPNSRSGSQSNVTLPYGSSGEDAYSEVHMRTSPLPMAEVDGEATETGVSKPPPVVFRESWHVKQERVRQKSAYGSHPGWRLLPILIKANDDLRQEELASQLIYRMAVILAREKVPVWLCPYDIIALTDRGGLIEAIPDTISIDSLKKNDPSYTNLRDFFFQHYGEGTEDLSDAKANFVESLAAYSMVCFLLQIKDRHNGNILIDSRGHVIHIDFGFFFLSSPGKNAGFESAPFKLTREFVELMDGPHSHLFHIFRELCVRSFLAMRKNCMEIILLVEMLKTGNEELNCFRGRPNDAIEGLRERFRLDLNDRACREYVNSLIDDSIENWRTDWYDRYQRYFVGVL